MLTRSFMRPESSKDLLAYTPMLHSRMFTETAKFRDHHFQPTRSGLALLPPENLVCSASDLYLDGNPIVDRPLFVQFCANSPDELLEAARYVQPFCDAVDLNLGCPQGIARKGNYGAFLQEDWDLIYNLIHTLHQNLDVPVTAKMRILETKEKTLEYAKVILSAGASIITVHGRQRDQKGHKTGLADWSAIRFLRENLPSDTVIFANGNILQHEDIKRCLEETGADGVMSAEGNLYDPTIFAKPPEVGHESREYWRGRDGKGGYRVDAIFRRYMDILYQYIIEKPSPLREPLFIESDLTNEAIPRTRELSQPPAKRLKRDASTPETASRDNLMELGPSQKPKQPHVPKNQKRAARSSKATSPNLLAMQPHLFHLLRPLVARHHPIRDALGRSRAGDIPAFENVLSLVEQAVKNGILDYASDPSKYETPSSPPVEHDEVHDESSVATVLACKRPWWVCQPYVRPLPKEALQNGSLTLSKKEKKRMEITGMSEAKAKAQRGMNVEDSKREEGSGLNMFENTEMGKESLVCG